MKNGSVSNCALFVTEWSYRNQSYENFKKETSSIGPLPLRRGVELRWIEPPTSYSAQRKWIDLLCEDLSQNHDDWERRIVYQIKNFTERDGIYYDFCFLLDVLDFPCFFY
jgi:hypothetical protein